MTTITKEFAVQGMHCQGCVSSVTGAVKRVPGVARVDVSLEKNAATVDFDPATADPAGIVAAIEAAGFDAQAR
jgi:copper ion binding protein